MSEQMNKTCWLQHCRNKSDVLVQQFMSTYCFPVCATHALELQEGLFLFEEQRIAAEVAERLTDDSM